MNNQITVQVDLDMTINGEPVTQMLEMPAELESLGYNKGLIVHLHIDAKKLARILGPVLIESVQTNTSKRGL